MYVFFVSKGNLYRFYLIQQCSFHKIVLSLLFDIIYIDGCNIIHKSRNVRKRTFWNVPPTKTQISLRNRAVWSENSLFTEDIL